MQTINYIDHISQPPNPPALWNHAQLTLDHLASGAGEVEIDKPLLKNGLGDGFQGGIGLAVKLDLVIQGGENVSDTMLGFN